MSVGRFRNMTLRDLEEVVRIENASFPTPWRREHFLHELKDNPHAWCVVLEQRGKVAAYSANWVIADEIHVNEIAVRPDLRGRGLGHRFLSLILGEARKRGCRRACLEVRPSNHPARTLYARLGFRETDRRRGYYRDTGEDAIVLTADLEAGPPGAERGSLAPERDGRL